MTTFNKISTTKYLGAFVLMIACSMILEYVGEYLWANHQISHYPQEIVSGILGQIGMFGIFALVPISAFRPQNRFSLSGDCKQRAKVFALSVFTAVGLFVLCVIAVGSAVGRN